MDRVAIFPGTVDVLSLGDSVTTPVTIIAGAIGFAAAAGPGFETVGLRVGLVPCDDVEEEVVNA